MRLGNEKKTGRGFALLEFQDSNRVECSLQTSSALDFDEKVDSEGNRTYGYKLWIGCDSPNPKICTTAMGWVAHELPEGVQCTTRMHLSREQVRSLVGHLQAWLENDETTFSAPEATQ